MNTRTAFDRGRLGMVVLLVGSAAQATAPRASAIGHFNSPEPEALAKAREDLRLSELTLARINREFDTIRVKSDVPPSVLEDYVIYLGRVRAMTVAQRRIVRDMEAVAKIAAVKVPADGNWPAVEPTIHDPELPGTEDELARLDRELRDSLREFDGWILEEQIEAQQRMERIDEASSDELTDLAQEAAAAVERLRKKGIDVETGAPPGDPPGSQQPPRTPGQQSPPQEQGESGDREQLPGNPSQTPGQCPPGQNPPGQQGSGTRGDQGQGDNPGQEQNKNQGNSEGERGGRDDGGDATDGDATGGGAAGSDQVAGSESEQRDSNAGEAGAGESETSVGDGGVDPSAGEPGAQGERTGSGAAGAPGNAGGQRSEDGPGGSASTDDGRRHGTGKNLPGEPNDGGIGNGNPGRPRGQGGRESGSSTDRAGGSGSGSGGTGRGEPVIGSAPSGQPGVPGAGRRDEPAAVEGRPSAIDDDIVARQLRQAAERETDPEMKRKLWEEYDRYKGKKPGASP